MHCISCRAEELNNILDIGHQPLSTRLTQKFSKLKTQNIHIHVAQCKVCGLIQLLGNKYIPFNDLRFPSLSFSEPTDYIEALCLRIDNYLKFSTQYKFVESSYNDKILTDKYDNCIANVISADIFDERSHFANIDQKLAHGDNNTPKFFLVRFILEHLFDVGNFLNNLHLRMSEKDFALIEVPLCEKIFSSQHFSLIWEEHRSYYTTTTLLRTLERYGFVTQDYAVYEQDYEDICSVIFKKTTSPTPVRDLITDSSMLPSLQLAFKAKLKRISYRLEKLSRRYQLYILGAGHHQIKFVDYYNIGQFITGFIDENPRKQGFLASKNDLRIYELDGIDFSTNNIILHTLNSARAHNFNQRLTAHDASGSELINLYSL